MKKNEAAAVAAAAVATTTPAGSAAYDFDPVVAAAWLYYGDQMTQGEIASVLQVSRATIVNHLQDARARGIVQITLANDAFVPIRLALELKQRYGLEDCIVIPDDGGRREPAQRVGEAGAWLLSLVIRAGDVLGVAWGQTVLALSRALVAKSVEDLSVVQITGSMMATYLFSPELCTSNIANRFNARCVNLHAPALLSRPEVKRLLCEEPALQEQLALIQRCSKIVFGVADVEPDSIVFGSGLCQPHELEPYIANGTVGVLAGRFMDRLGRPVPGHLDDRMIGLTLEEIRRIPQRICVAAGDNKSLALHAAMTGRYATTLVTDEKTAVAMLAIGAA